MVPTSLPEPSILYAPFGFLSNRAKPAPALGAPCGWGQPRRVQPNSCWHIFSNHHSKEYLSLQSLQRSRHWPKKSSQRHTETFHGDAVGVGMLRVKKKASRSSLNPPGPPGKTKNLSFRTRNFREKFGEKSLLALLTPFLGTPPGRWTGDGPGWYDHKMPHRKRLVRTHRHPASG